MRLLISADIEGTADIATWNETSKSDPEYEYFRRQMTGEVKAACQGALDSGKADSILVRDAHGSACNIIPEELPKSVSIMRSWEGAPGGMMSGIRENIDAVAMTGYHSAAYTAGNPLAHTMNRQNQFVRINGKNASEFMINTYTAAYYGVPVIFVSGDELLCETAKELCPDIETVITNKAYGDACIGVHPLKAREMIHNGIKCALEKGLQDKVIRLPEHFSVEVEFKEYGKAYRGSFFPGAQKVGPKGISFENDDFYEVLRFFFFTL